MTMEQALDKAGLLIDLCCDLDATDIGDQLRADGVSVDAIDRVLAARRSVWMTARRQGLELVRAYWLTGSGVH